MLSDFIENISKEMESLISKKYNYQMRRMVIKYK